MLSIKIRLAALTFTALIGVVSSHHAYAGVDLTPVFGATFEREHSGGFCDTATSFSLVSTGTVRVGTNEELCDAEERGAYEFDLTPALGGDPIDTAQLILSGGLPNTVDVHGFEGNGTAEDADGNENNVIASGDGSAVIDVTAFIQTLTSGPAMFAGFMLDVPSINSGGDAGNFPLRVYSSAAVLSINGGAPTPPPPPPEPPPFGDAAFESVFGATFEREHSGGICDTATSFSLISNGTVRVGTNEELCDAEERGAFEFDLAPLTGLDPIDRIFLFLSDEIDPGIDVHGFIGNGSIDDSDANFENIIGSGDGSSLVDVTAFVKPLLEDGEPFAGFMLDDPSVATSGSAGNAPLRVYFDTGELIVLFVPPVTEPSSLALFTGLLAAAGMSVRKWRR